MKANQSNRTMAGAETLGKRMWPLIRDMPQLRYSVQSKQNQSQTERKLIKKQKREN